MAMFGLFGNKKKTSSSVAKDRLKLVLIHDRAGTSSNNEMIEMMKRDILKVIRIRAGYQDGKRRKGPRVFRDRRQYSHQAGAQDGQKQILARWAEKTGRTAGFFDARKAPPAIRASGAFYANSVRD